ncbi:CrcB family protein [Eubacteriaceae bacterium ES2]|nr:CrcB family protein [Eubacteriaceae bacterium ES2]
MKKYYLIGIGGAVGALLRFQIKSIPDLFNSPDQLINIALNILLINIIGSFLLGFLNTLFSQTDRISVDIKLGFTTGLIGAFTTFSTFCKESIMIINAGYYSFFVFYLFASLSLGVLLVYMGHLLATYFVYPFVSSSLAKNSDIEHS